MNDDVTARWLCDWLLSAMTFIDWQFVIVPQWLSTSGSPVIPTENLNLLLSIFLILHLPANEATNHRLPVYTGLRTRTGCDCVFPFQGVILKWKMKSPKFVLFLFLYFWHAAVTPAHWSIDEYWSERSSDKSSVPRVPGGSRFGSGCLLTQTSW